MEEMITITLPWWFIYLFIGYMTVHFALSIADMVLRYMKRYYEKKLQRLNEEMLVEYKRMKEED